MSIGNLKNAFRAATVAVSAALMSSTAQAAPVAVDLELSLLVDVSGSVSASEFALQRDGYVNAFNNAAVQAAILAGNLGKIAVNYIYWSGNSSQQESVGWTLIDSVTAAQDFASAIAAVGRPFGGQTAVQSAIAYASPLFDKNDFVGTRNVIDISGDGGDNNSPSGLDASGDFCGQGDAYAINGVVIGGSSGVLSEYQNEVQCGANSFTLAATSFGDFGDAIQQKLIREITPVGPDAYIPLPAAGWLLLGGIGGLVALRRKKAA